MAVPALISGGIDIPFANGFDVTLSWSRILIIVVTVVLMAVLAFYIRHSRMGRASRACSQDMQMARLLGIDTNKVISFTFMLGAVLAAVGGVLIAITVGKLNPFIGFIAGARHLHRRSFPLMQPIYCIIPLFPSRRAENHTKHD